MQEKCICFFMSVLNSMIILFCEIYIHSYSTNNVDRIIDDDTHTADTINYYYLKKKLFNFK